MLSLSATIYLCEIANYEMKNLYYLYYFDAYYVPAIIELILTEYVPAFIE